MLAKKLNLDIPGAISDFESVMREFLIKRVVYRGVFRGKGLEFDGYRNFVPDDDASFIDWKASARTNKLLVKKYIEERNLRIMFVVDVGDNMVFGSQKKLKCEYAAEVSAALGHLIIGSSDKLGLLLFSDKIVKILMPELGMNQFGLFSDYLSDSKMYGGNSKIEGVLDYLIDYLDESIGCVIIVSDFVKFNKNLFSKFELVANKFETMAIMMKDPLDVTLPDFGREMLFEDPVTHKQMIINPKIARKVYEKNALEQEKIAINTFKNCNIDVLKLVTDKSFAEPLANFLKERVIKGKYMVAE